LNFACILRVLGSYIFSRTEVARREETSRRQERRSITLVRAGKQEFVVPTELLRKSCPALKLNSPKEEEGTVTHVDLSGVDEAAFEIVAQYFRTGELPELTIQNVIDVYCSASDLGIGQLEKKCWKHVFRLMSPEEQSLILFAEMEKSDWNINDKKVIMEHLCRRLKQVVNTSSYLQLNITQVPTKVSTTRSERSSTVLNGGRTTCQTQTKNNLHRTNRTDLTGSPSRKDVPIGHRTAKAKQAKHRHTKQITLPRHMYVNQPIRKGEVVTDGVRVKEKTSVLKSVEGKIKRLVKPGTSRTRSKNPSKGSNLKVSAPPPMKADVPKKASARTGFSKRPTSPKASPRRQRHSAGEFCLSTDGNEGSWKNRPRRSTSASRRPHNKRTGRIRHPCGHCKFHNKSSNRVQNRWSPSQVTDIPKSTRAPPPSMESPNRSVRLNVRMPRCKHCANSSSKRRTVTANDVSHVPMALSNTSENSSGELGSSNVENTWHD
ncbi:hypothetical protein BIW11_04867, partial [Tropilaelaps mercedesae]